MDIVLTFTIQTNIHDITTTVSEIGRRRLEKNKYFKTLIMRLTFITTLSDNDPVH
jgi:hypothetical protein